MILNQNKMIVPYFMKQFNISSAITSKLNLIPRRSLFDQILQTPSTQMPRIPNFNITISI